MAAWGARCSARGGALQAEPDRLVTLNSPFLCRHIESKGNAETSATKHVSSLPPQRHSGRTTRRRAFSHRAPRVG
eukprot:2066577-Pyramimonas_sp.AAC.1